MPSKTQLGPRISESLAEDYRRFVKFTNDGTYKGRLGDAIEHAIKLQIALHFIRHPEELKHANEAEYIDDPGFKNQMEHHIDAVGHEVLEAAQMMDLPNTSASIEQASTPSVAFPSEENAVGWRNVRTQLFGESPVEESASTDELMERIDRLEKIMTDFVETEQNGVNGSKEHATSSTHSQDDNSSTAKQ